MSFYGIGTAQRLLDFVRQDKKILDFVPLSKMDRILVNLACMGEGKGALEGQVGIEGGVWAKMREDESVRPCQGLASQV